MTIIYCANCTGPFEASMSRINRARSVGAPLYCGRMCAGMARRSTLDVSERQAAKAAYDRKYRGLHRGTIQSKKAAYYRDNREVIEAKHKVYRKKHMARHVAYCRQPEYRAYKSEYDRNRRAQLQFGPFAESFLVLQRVEQQLDSQATKYERMLANGTINKAQARRRAL